MINNRLISSKVVLAKVIADLNLKDSEIRISDIKEWIFEGIMRIGAITQFDHKVAVIPINHHQASLPCDLYKLDQVAYSHCDHGGWLPMRKSTSSFGVHYHADKHGRPDLFVHDEDMLPLVKNMFNLTNDEEALKKLNGDINLKKTLDVLINHHTVHGPRNIGAYIPGKYSLDLQYTTKPGYINTNVPEGYLKVSYYAIYTDEDSMPLIPDLESYKEAITWYVIKKLMYPKKLKGIITERDYRDMCSSWEYYRKLAYGDAMMPNTADELKSVQNTWNKLYPEINDHDIFFDTTGEEQIIYNQNWRL